MSTAIVLTEQSANNLRWDRHERERRQFATERVCDLVAMGLVESSHYTVRRMTAPALGHDVARQAAIAAFPGYVFLRDFLIGELDADPVVAARVAAKHTASHNRFRRYITDLDAFAASREVGWL